MNTPIIWLLIPMVLGIVLLFFQKQETTIFLLGVLLCFFLVVIALFLPFDEVYSLGTTSISLDNQLNFAGLQIQFTNQTRPILIFFYSFLALIYLGTYIVKTSPNFIPISLIINSLILVGITVTPALFGILFFLTAVLISMFLLIFPGSKSINGAIRFLSFQLMGMTILLLAGWSLSTGTGILESSQSIQRALLLFWVGFSFCFAIFPLNSWVTMLSENGHPYVVGYIFASFFGGYSIFIITIINTYLGFLENEVIISLLHIAGFVLILSGGVGAAIVQNVGRLFGFAVLIEVGYSLLVITTNNPNLFYSMLVPKVFSLSLWTMGLSILRSYGNNFSFQALRGLGFKFPVVSTTMIIAQFSLAGVPLLAGFPVLLQIWREVAEFSTILATWVFLGSLGLMVGTLRTFSALMSDASELDIREEGENIYIYYLVAGVVFLFLMGLFPHWIQFFTNRLLEGVELLNLIAN